MPGCAVYMAHLDRGQFIHRIVDVRGGGRLRAALQPGAPARRRVLLAHGRGPRAAPVRRRRPPRGLLARCAMQQRVGARVLPGRAAGALRRHAGRLARRAVAARATPSRAADEQLFVMLARVLASELERESNARDLRRFNDMLRDQAKGMGAIGRVAKALAAGDDARQSICEAACEVMDAPGRVPAGAQGPRLRRRPRWRASTVAAGDDPAARRRSGLRQGVHGQGGVLRRRRAQPPRAGGAAGRGDLAPAPRSSSRSCATARSAAC